jgi:hypothetical protein
VEGEPSWGVDMARKMAGSRAFCAWKRRSCEFVSLIHDVYFEETHEYRHHLCSASHPHHF